MPGIAAYFAAGINFTSVIIDKSHIINRIKLAGNDLKTATLTQLATLENIAGFRDFIEKFCRNNEIDDETCFALQLSADEACANIIEHGYKGMSTGEISFEIAIGAGEVHLKIRDTGPAFDPKNAPLPDTTALLDERDIGGLGIFFIYSMVDSVQYESTTQGNTLTLTKKLS